MQQEDTAHHHASSLVQQRWQDEFMKAAFALNKAKAQELIEQAFQHYTPEEVCLLFIQPVLYHIGYLWQENQISWINENFASTLIYTALRQKLQSTHQNVAGPVIFMSGVPEETHEIGLLMLAFFWKRSGLNISYHGQMKTGQELFQAIMQVRPAIVCLSAMTKHRAKSLVPISQALTRLPPPQPLLCYGGGAFLQESPLQQQIQGMYLGSDAALATRQVQMLLQWFK